MKKVISAALILLAAFVAFPVMARTQTNRSENVQNQAPVDKVCDYLNSVTAEMARCTSPSEAQSVLENMDASGYIDVTNEDFYNYKLSVADKQKIIDTMGELICAMGNAYGANDRTDEIVNQMGAVIYNGVSRATTLSEAFVNIGMNIFSNATGRSSF